MKINNITNINNNYNSNKQTSFKGYVPQFAVRDITKFFSKITKNDTFQKGIHSFSHSDNTFTHLLAIESGILSSFYMICTLRNKKIEDEQKPQMLINDTLTLGFATAGAYLTDDKINKAVAGRVDKYFEKNKDFYINLGEKDKETRLNELLTKSEDVIKNNGEGLESTIKTLDKHLKNIVGKEGKLKTFEITEKTLSETKESVRETLINAETKEEAKEKIKTLTEPFYKASAAKNQATKISSGISKLKGLVIFGFIYRFVSPVVFTPIANKLSSRFFPSKKDIAEQKQ